MTVSLLPILLILAIVGVLVAIAGRRHGLRIALVGLALLVIVGGVLLLRVQAPLHTPRRVVISPVVWQDPQSVARVKLANGNVAVVTTKSTLADLEPELRAIAESPVRCEQRELLIGAHATLEQRCGDTPIPPEIDLPDVPQIDSPDGQPLNAHAAQSHLSQLVRVAAEREVADKLALYFNRLLAAPPPADAGLHRLRTTLRAMRAADRQSLAREASRNPNIVARTNAITVGDLDAQGREHHVIEIAVALDGLQQLGEAKLTTQRRRHVGTRAMILGIVGTLVVAAIILKASTRHTTRTVRSSS